MAATRTEKRHARKRGEHHNLRVLPPDKPRSAHPLDRIVLNGRWLKLQVGDRLTEVTLERTTEGPTSLSLSLWDGDRAIMRRAGLLGDERLAKRSWIQLDKLYYELAGIERQGDDLLLATFEDWIVSELKRHGKGKPVRVSRDVMTRAEFCAALIRQAGVRVIVLDEHKIQPIQGVKRLREEIRKAARQDATSGRSGVLAGVNKIYPAHSLAQAQANPDGYAWLSTRQVRAIYEAVGFTPTQALHMAQISHGESGLQIGGDWRHYPGIVASDNGIGLLQVTPTEAAWGSRSNPVWTWLANLGGASAMRNPVQNARMGKALFDDGGLAPWHGTRYLDESSQAAGPVLKAGQEAAILSDARSGGVPPAAYTKDFAFDRKRDESTWACVKRLMDEVRWRVFVREGVVVIASDPALMRQVPSMTIREHSDAVPGSLQFQWHKALRVTEMSCSAHVGRWQADPGEVVGVEGQPLLDDRWLLSTVRSSLMTQDKLADIALRAPQQPLPEPAPEVVSAPTSAAAAGSTGASIEGVPDEIAAAYEAAGQIDAKDYPYRWGGGHGSAGVPSAGSPPGYDCSGAVSAMLAAAGILDGGPRTSGGFLSWGEAGRGKYLTLYTNTTHIFAVFTLPGHETRFWGTSQSNPDGGAGFHPARDTSAFTARHYPGL